AALLSPCCDLETLDQLRRWLTPELPFLGLQRILYLRGVVPDPTGWSFTQELFQELIPRLDGHCMQEGLEWWLERENTRERIRQSGRWLPRPRLLGLWQSEGIRRISEHDLQRLHLASVSRLAENPFDVLGLRPGCTAAEVERAGATLLGMLAAGVTEAST